MSRKNMVDLNQPDAFISMADKLGKLLAKNKNILLGVIVFAVVLATGYVVQKEMVKSAEQAAANELYNIEKQIDEKQQDFDKKQADSKNKKDKTSVKSVKIDFDKEYLALSAQYEDVILKHKDTNAAMSGTFKIIGLYLENEKFDKALKLTEKLGKLKQNNLLTPLYHLLKGTVLNHTKQYEKAVVFYQKVIDDKNVPFLHAEASLKLGLTYKNLNDMEKAKEYFQKTRDTYSDTEASRLAKSYLRLLKVN